MPGFTDLLTDDESVAVKASADFPALVPAHQRAAYGTDGTLGGDGWTLGTAANLSGLTAGHVVHLQRGAGGDWRDLLAVESVGTGDAAGTVELRRIGMDAGDGPPPTVASGLLFYAPTALPQIRRATAGILRRFGFASYADIAAGRDGTGDAEDFRPLATLNVLIDLLGTQHRAGTSEENFHTKYRDLLAERDALSAELVESYAIGTAKTLHAAVMQLPTYRPTSASEF